MVCVGREVPVALARGVDGVKTLLGLLSSKHQSVPGHAKGVKMGY